MPNNNYDTLSFPKAFKNAREDKREIFNWNNKQYHSYTREELLADKETTQRLADTYKWNSKMRNEFGLGDAEVTLKQDPKKSPKQEQKGETSSLQKPTNNQYNSNYASPVLDGFFQNNIDLARLEQNFNPRSERDLFDRGMPIPGAYNDGQSLGEVMNLVGMGQLGSVAKTGVVNMVKMLKSPELVQQMIKQSPGVSEYLAKVFTKDLGMQPIQAQKIVQLAGQGDVQAANEIKAMLGGLIEKGVGQNVAKAERLGQVIGKMESTMTPKQVDLARLIQQTVSGRMPQKESQKLVQWIMELDQAGINNTNLFGGSTLPLGY